MRLRHDDEAGGEPGRGHRAHSAASDWPLDDAADAGADDLGDERGRVERQRRERATEIPARRRMPPVRLNFPATGTRSEIGMPVDEVGQQGQSTISMPSTDPEHGQTLARFHLLFVRISRKQDGYAITAMTSARRMLLRSRCRRPAAERQRPRFVDDDDVRILLACCKRFVRIDGRTARTPEIPEEDDQQRRNIAEDLHIDHATAWRSASSSTAGRCRSRKPMIVEVIMPATATRMRVEETNQERAAIGRDHWYRRSASARHRSRHVRSGSRSRTSILARFRFSMALCRHAIDGRDDQQTAMPGPGR